MNIKKCKKSIFLVLVILAIIPILSACSHDGGETASASNGENKTIVFTNAGWDSIGFHNAVAMKIVEEGYGYATEEIVATEQMSLMGLQQGDVDVYMEIWTGNIIDKYNQIVEDEEIVELGINYSDNEQGLYVPTYVIEGDEERGIQPMAPGLQNIKDLKEYPEIFPDEEDPSKGRIYGSVSGWTADQALQEKLKTYGLDEYYNYFNPGSDSGLSASLSSAYERGEPWVGYYWEPTWVTGKYDMTLLEDEPHDEEKWNNGFETKFPSQDLTIAVNTEFPEQYPEIVEFLKNYKTSSDITSSALAYMQENEVETSEAAIWFLREYEDLWREWVPTEVAQKVRNSL